MFTKVLIANRGAIACRVMRTLHRLGVASVAIYSEADAGARHVSLAGEAVCVGGAAVSSSYLAMQRIVDAALATGAQAIHPGYGFLSENAGFAELCEAAGLVFLGPTPQQMRLFGLKHTARDLARAAGVPLLPGSGLLSSLEQALGEAGRIGYPVMLKSSAGGGGIGMQMCASADDLPAAFDTVRRLATANFSDGGVFVERFITDARHIEVQVFGDGAGGVIALGERDCSLQRRHQKVIEETPAPNLRAEVRTALLDTATALARAAAYRSAGTVEFVVDAHTQEFFFLEVNARLQVEHGVTEAVTGIDLVEWMLLLGAGDLPSLSQLKVEPRGHAVQARLYAEDPHKNFQPCTGVLTEVVFPDTLRIDTWVERGTEVTAHYDPMLAKLIAHGDSREQALAALADGLAATRVGGLESNLGMLRALLSFEPFSSGRHTTRSLAGFRAASRAIDILSPGVQTSVQDWPGRLGFWSVGVPPSGPMDAHAHRLANRLLGNPPGAAALEITVAGPTLVARCDLEVAVAGAPAELWRDGEPVAMHEVLVLRAGQTLRLGRISSGCRAVLAVAGGFDLPAYLGSAATFTLGQFGGHGGRLLRAGDVLHVGEPAALPRLATQDAARQVPAYGSVWSIGVLVGPHAAPDFFTADDMAMLLATDWRVHYNSSRTGVRLIGPKPAFARRDGGEAGLHPSNIHDNAYAVGAIDFTGDMPVILGPDGPSLGGFVCPAVVVHAELWKLGQLAPGHSVRFHALTLEEATALALAEDAALGDDSAADDRAAAAVAPSISRPLDAAIPSISRPLDAVIPSTSRPLDAAIPSTSRPLDAAIPSISRPLDAAIPSISRPLDAAVVHRLPADGAKVEVVYRRAGDRYLLVEFGPPVLDLRLRFQAHALMVRLQAWRDAGRLPGIIDLTPGIRSLQVHFNALRLPLPALLDALLAAQDEVDAITDIEVPSRTVWLPLSWDDPATQLAIAKYQQSVRADAPWCPSNIEFIRRINGLPDVQAVFDIVFAARYLVLGLGDVYLGAPVATPLDPRHRLVTTKYNPARTWTPENAVGIGGAYLCVYGMEGPGGYQFVGRTVPVWNRWRDRDNGALQFEPGKPWLLRFFDQIRFYPVSADELLTLRHDVAAGRATLRMEDGVFRLSEHERLLQDDAPAIAAFKQRQQAAFDAERERWREAGLSETPLETDAGGEGVGDGPAHAAALAVATFDGEVIGSQVAGGVWAVLVQAGAAVHAGQTLVVVESMKMEIAVQAPRDGVVERLLCSAGQPVAAGQALLLLR